MTENISADPGRLAAIEENIKVIRENIAEAAVKSGRAPSDVRLMAVTKTVEPVYINHAIDCGIDLIGENKVQEFLGKKDSLRLDGVEKRLIGHLQTNKVRKILTEVDMIESVDGVGVAEEIQRQAEIHGVTAQILVEVNIGAEESKTGLPAGQLEELLGRIAEMPRLKVRGLMTIPPICEKRSELLKFFEEMYKLFIDIRAKNSDNNEMDILSMGMSGDYREAVLCGSNSVRVGSAIFGPRIYV